MTVLAHELNDCKLNKNKKKKKSGEWYSFQFYMCTMAQNKLGGGKSRLYYSLKLMNAPSIQSG